MKIFNVRLGLATNSSSSHSLIFIPNQTYGDDAQGEYGWDDFTIGSRKGKLRYGAAILQNSLKKAGFPDEYLGFTIAGLLGEDVELNKSDYIDHQSEYYLPCGIGSDVPDPEFVREFRDFLLRDDLVILGGNDNDGDHPLASGGFNLPFQVEGSAKMVCRKDPEYGFWTMFAPHSGAKIRFSFNDLDNAPEKAYAPELVDLKITDYCPFDCPFCYQDSTKKGQHAHYYEQIYPVIRALSELKVFEVAIGGGEPTMHPEFDQILKECRWNNIVPNFTTKSLDWLKDRERCSSIMETAGAFAFSVISPDDVDKLAALVDKNDIEPHQVSIQVVMGVHDRDKFEEIIRRANKSDLRVTLLGYKTNGRGADCVPIAYDWWADVIKDNSPKYFTPICIDTALAEQYKDKLDELGIPEWSYHTKEGKFSMYIDAVTGSVAPSSYCDGSEIWELVKGVVTPSKFDRFDWGERIRKAFAHF